MRSIARTANKIQLKYFSYRIYIYVWVIRNVIHRNVWFSIMRLVQELCALVILSSAQAQLKYFESYPKRNAQWFTIKFDPCVIFSVKGGGCMDRCALWSMDFSITSNLWKSLGKWNDFQLSCLSRPELSRFATVLVIVHCSHFKWNRIYLVLFERVILIGKEFLASRFIYIIRRSKEVCSWRWSGWCF